MESNILIDWSSYDQDWIEDIGADHTKINVDGLNVYIIKKDTGYFLNCNYITSKSEYLTFQTAKNNALPFVMRIKNGTEKPTVEDVANILEDIKSSFNIPTIDTTKELQKLIGINDRTIRRWKNKHTESPLVISKISYSEWCKLILIAKNEVIFPAKIKCVDQAELYIIANDLICNSQNFKGCSAEQVMLFVGKNSFTGLTRSEICKIFKWNTKAFSDSIYKETVSFSTIAMLLILCGVNKDKLFNLIA